MRYILILCCFCILCGNSRCQSMRGKHVDHLTDINEEEVKDHIAQLANGQNLDDADAELAYNHARDALIKMGSGVEPHIIFEIKNGRDWSVRFGCIEVLNGIGTKKCIDSLLLCLQDKHPLVVQKAMYSLRVFCEHRIVPSEDMPGAVVPPIPRRKEHEHMNRDYELWADWLEDNQKALHRAWSEWWKANKSEVNIL